MQVRTAVFPVAGMGSRFLPATKANPKEMLPIVDKPLIQYAVEEAIAAGITRLVFVTSESKRAIEDHFDTNFELEARLSMAGKTDMLALVRGILPDGVTAIYIRQPEPLGLGHAVLCAEPVVGDEPFVILLADDLIDSGVDVGCVQQMIDVYQANNQASVLSVQPVAANDTDKYGIVSLVASGQGSQIEAIVEKPKPADAPSTLGVVGRYLLNPSIFSYLKQIEKGAGGEIQLTDAIALQLRQEVVLAHAFVGTRYDCGNKLGYLQATLNYGIRHPEVGSEFKQYLQQFTAKHS